MVSRGCVNALYAQLLWSGFTDVRVDNTAVFTMPEDADNDGDDADDAADQPIIDWGAAFGQRSPADPFGQHAADPMDDRNEDW